MKHTTRLLLLILSLVITSGLYATDHVESLPELSYKKVTLAKDDLYAFWELNQALVNGPKDHIKHVTLENFGPFEAFYDETVKSQSIPHEDNVYIELNPFSGIYLFYLNQLEQKPIGFLRISASFDYGIVEESVVFKAGSPKGAGTSALQILTELIKQFRGQTLLFCIEQEGTSPKQPAYRFAEATFYHVMGGIEYINIPSLIAHTRIGMEPFLTVKGEKEGTYLVYPPLDYVFYEKLFPDFYRERLVPQKDIVEKLRPVLQDVASKEAQTRMSAIAKLKKSLS
jgi:hypothetical protein